MPLISSIRKDNITVLNTFKNKSGNNIIHVLESKVPGLPVRKKLICCDGAGNPYKIKDFGKNGVDVYEKAQDGSTILKTPDGKIKQMPFSNFMDLCKKLF